MCWSYLYGWCTYELVSVLVVNDCMLKIPLNLKSMTDGIMNQFVSTIPS